MVLDGQQWIDVGIGDIDCFGQQCIVDCCVVGQLGLVDFDLQVFGLVVFFDQVLVVDYVEQQVDDVELFGDVDFVFGLCWLVGQQCGGEVQVQVECGDQVGEMGNVVYGNVFGEKGEVCVVVRMVCCFGWWCGRVCVVGGLGNCW